MNRAQRRAHNHVGRHLSLAHGGGRDPSTTTACSADDGIYAWPKCAICSMRKGLVYPVEGYSVEPAKPSSLSIKQTLVVRAECSHGHGMTAEAVRHQTARIDVPYHWGQAQVFKAIRELIFFRPGHSMAENAMLL